MSSDPAKAARIRAIGLILPMKRTRKIRVTPTTIFAPEELLEKSPLLAQFRAVQNGNVWCTGKNMYQETTQLGQMIQSFRKIFSGEADNLTELPFLYRLG